MKLATASRYFHTLRCLRPTQVLGRVWRVVHTVKVDASPAPPQRTSQHWTVPVERQASWLSPTRRRFLNHERECGEASDWNASGVPKLWLYNLHYFEDLCATSAADRREWHQATIARWIAENAPGVGNGWEAYPTSLRIVNWVKWDLGHGELSKDAIHSLAIQARYLRDSLEHHLLGNHLFANAKALVFAGCFFDGSEAESWLEKGLALVRRELAEQVLHDGGHFERSAMYHSLFLEDLLDLINLAEAMPRAMQAHWSDCVAEWKNTARRMRRWLMIMTHPDGELALFNDCAAGIAPEPDQLNGYARRLGLGPAPLPSPGVQLLPYSGFVRIENDDALAILDVGEIGPSYLPGHAHADSLSFEFSLFGERVVVDSGTSLYETNAERLRQRSTLAHNTVVVDEQDSSEVWSSFRVARRAYPHDLHVEESRDAIRVRCGHDGYMRLPGRVFHQREWTLERQSLEIHDTLVGEFVSASAQLHLHPAVQLESSSQFRLPGNEALSLSTAGSTPRVHGTTWHPQFGISMDNTRLEIPFHSNELRSTLHW